MPGSPLIIYITGYEKGAGKTTTSLGLLHLLSRRCNPEELAYIKPVSNNPVVTPGGNFVDRDVTLIERFAGAHCVDERHSSPIHITTEFIQAFLSSPNKQQVKQRLQKTLTEAVAHFKDKKIIIAEGTGSPASGSLVGLSNAEAAALIGAKVIYLSGDNYYHTIEPLAAHAVFFRTRDVPVTGLLFNKVSPKKVTYLTHYLNSDFFEFFLSPPAGSFPDGAGAPQAVLPPAASPPGIMGFLPVIEGLPNPSMKGIHQHLKKAMVIGDTEKEAWKVPCRSIRIISVPTEIITLERYLESQDVALIEAGSHKRIQAVIDFNNHLAAPIGGMVLTSVSEDHMDKGKSGDRDEDSYKELPPSLRKNILKSGIPALVTTDDTATAELKLRRCFETTKLQLFDDNKARKIEKLFEDHFDFDTFKRIFGISDTGK